MNNLFRLITTLSGAPECSIFKIGCQRLFFYIYIFQNIIQITICQKVIPYHNLLCRKIPKICRGLTDILTGLQFGGGLYRRAQPYLGGGVVQFCNTLSIFSFTHRKYFSIDLSSLDMMDLVLPMIFT